MYGIFTYIYHKNQRPMGKETTESLIIPHEFTILEQLIFNGQSPFHVFLLSLKKKKLYWISIY